MSRTSLEQIDSFRVTTSNLHMSPHWRSAIEVIVEYEVDAFANDPLFNKCVYVCVCVCMCMEICDLRVCVCVCVCVWKYATYMCVYICVWKYATQVILV